MTLAGWSPRKMPLQVPQEPIITEQKNGGVTTPAPLAVPDQDATVRTNPITGELNVLASSQQVRTGSERGSPALCWMPSSRGGAYYETRRSARWTRDLYDDAAVGASDVRRRRWLPRTARISTWPRSTLTVIEVSIPQACHLSRAPPTTMRPVGAVTPLPAHLVVCDPPVGLAQRPEATADRTGVGWRFP